jgi:hypothetical protein
MAETLAIAAAGVVLVGGCCVFSLWVVGKIEDEKRQRDAIKRAYWVHKKKGPRD